MLFIRLINSTFDRLGQMILTSEICQDGIKLKINLCLLELQKLKLEQNTCQILNN